MRRQNVSVWLAGAGSLAVALGGGACGNVHDDLLSVQTPDIISIDAQNSPAGAQAWFTSAVGDFAQAFCGDRANNTPLGVCVPVGMFTDELFTARAGIDGWDKRTVDNTTIPQSTWNQLMLAHSRSLRAEHLLIQYPPATGLNTQLATLKANEGFTLLFLAENYCNGLPLWDGKDETNVVTVTLSTTDLYTAAIAQFDSALALIAATNPQIRQLALVGKARTIVDQAKAGGQAASYATAAALVGEVPTAFVVNAVYSASSQGMENGLYDWGFNTPNWGASNAEGVNGVDFVQARDPRVNIDPVKTVACQDGTRCPIFNHYNKPDAPVPIATGIEARLIEAESQLASGNSDAWLATLNLLRSTPQKYGTVTTNGAQPKTYVDDNVSRAGLAPLTDPGTPAARITLHFRERGFWLYLTAHRLGDFRRLIRQYGRTADAVFPTGAYFKGGAYGTDVVLPPNNTETNNPNWKACTDNLP